MNRLPVLYIMLLTVAAASACSGNEAKTSPRAVSDKPQMATSKLTSPKSFRDGMDELDRAIAGAKGDPCRLLDVMAVANFAAPSDATEAKRAIVSVRRYLDAMADGAPSSQHENATIIKEAAAKMLDQAAKANFDPAKLGQPETLSAMNSPEVIEAIGEFQQEVSVSCHGDHVTTTVG